MSDWADEEGKRVAQDGWLDSKPLHEHIAAALRKAKADGMNEVADWISVTGSTELRQYVRQIRDRAARVEQPR